METISFRNKDMYWDIAATLQFPPGFEPAKQYPAIISAHPIGSCKEQTSGNLLERVVPFFKKHLAA